MLRENARGRKAEMLGGHVVEWKRSGWQWRRLQMIFELGGSYRMMAGSRRIGLKFLTTKTSVVVRLSLQEFVCAVCPITVALQDGAGMSYPGPD